MPAAAACSLTHAGIAPTAPAMLSIASSEPLFVHVENQPLAHPPRFSDRLPAADSNAFWLGGLPPSKRHAAAFTFSRITRGCLAAMRSKAIAGPSGCRRPCSQLRRV